MTKAKVIIIGGGFGGINAAKAFRKSDIDVLVIDKTNHHVFQPLLYQVASAALSPGDIASPIREIVKHQPNTTVIMADIVSIDTTKKQVVADDGKAFSYDYLIIATGAMHSYFGHPEWEAFAPGLKTLRDAICIREHILIAFEKAERCENLDEASKYLRFVIIGGGPTGVEMAGAVAEIAYKTMFKNFRKIKPEQSEIYLIEGQSHVLPSFPVSLSNIARRDLERLGVKVMTDTRVTDIRENGVYLGERLIETVNVIWAAGNQASPLLQSLPVPLDRQGRGIVEPDLSIPGYPDVFIIGDAAHAKGKDGLPLPGMAPVAIQQGRYVANIIKKGIDPSKRRAFKYLDKGMMATIGKAKAVATMGKLSFSGYLAWFAWCFIHIRYLISFRSRALVMLQWVFLYIWGKHTVRLITRSIDDKKHEGSE